MAVTNFIPELWAAKILRNLHNMHVFAQPNVINRNYEGEIKAQGDTVRITSIGAITVSDYTKNTNMATPQTLQDAQQTLVIEKAKSFAFSVDDVDRVQGNPAAFDEAAYEAAYAMSDVQDQYLANLYAYAGSFLGTDGSPKTLSAASDLYPIITQAKVKLGELKVPDDGNRWLIVPEWGEGVMAQDNRFVMNYNPAIYGTLLNGQVTKIAGFNVLRSNNITNDGSGNYRFMAGHPMAITLADQVAQVEGFRSQLFFGDVLRGLQLYGAKVVRPQALVTITVTRPSFI